MGLTFVWYSEGVVNVKLFKYVLKQRLRDNYLTEWTKAVSNSNDGILSRTYRFKLVYNQFTNSITNPSYRYSFLKFVTKITIYLLYVVNGFNCLCSTCGILGDE